MGNKKKLFKKTKKKFSLKEKYLESWKFIKQSRNFIYLGIFIFLIAGIFGYYLNAPELSKTITEYLKQILAQTEGLSSFGLIKFIFLNNLEVSFFAMFLGVLFGLVPVLFAISNGFVIGFVAEKVVNSGGVLSLWRLLPHGIFELPAVFISIGLGIRLGSFLFKRNKKDLIKKAFLAFVLFVIPLLIIAGIIEGFLIYFF